MSILNYDFNIDLYMIKLHYFEIYKVQFISIFIQINNVRIFKNFKSVGHRSHFTSQIHIGSARYSLNPIIFLWSNPMNFCWQIRGICLVKWKPNSIMIYIHVIITIYLIIFIIILLLYYLLYLLIR